MNMIKRLNAPGLGLLMMTCAILPAGAFSLTGTYKGVVVCDSTTAGETSSWGWNIESLIVQDGENLRVDDKYVDTSELGNEYTLYSGKATTSADGAVVSAY